MNRGADFESLARALLRHLYVLRISCVGVGFRCVKFSFAQFITLGKAITVIYVRDRGTGTKGNLHSDEASVTRLRGCHCRRGYLFL